MDEELFYELRKDACDAFTILQFDIKHRYDYPPCESVCWTDLYPRMTNVLRVVLYLDNADRYLTDADREKAIHLACEICRSLIKLPSKPHIDLHYVIDNNQVNVLCEALACIDPSLTFSLTLLSHEKVNKKTCQKILDACHRHTLSGCALYGRFKWTTTQWTMLCDILASCPFLSFLDIDSYIQKQEQMDAFLTILKRANVQQVNCRVKESFYLSLAEGIQHQLLYKPYYEVCNLRLKSPTPIAASAVHSLVHAIRYVCKPCYISFESAYEEPFSYTLKDREGFAERTDLMMVLCSAKRIPRLGANSALKMLPMDILQRLQSYFHIGRVCAGW